MFPAYVLFMVAVLWLGYIVVNFILVKNKSKEKRYELKIRPFRLCKNRYLIEWNEFLFVFEAALRERSSRSVFSVYLNNWKERQDYCLII